MDDISDLKVRVKRMLVDTLMLQIAPEEIGDDQPLFGPDGLGLDSVDALQLVVALEKNYGIKIPNPETARRICHSVRTISEEIEAHREQG